MEKAGLSMAMGAFLLGVTLSASDYRYQVEASVLPLKGLFMALFFVAVGVGIIIYLLQRDVMDYYEIDSSRAAAVGTAIGLAVAYYALLFGGALGISALKGS